MGKIKSINENDEVFQEQLKEIKEEPESLEEVDEDRTVNTQDFGNQDESDFKPQEIEELIDEEEDRRANEQKIPEGGLD